MIVYILVVCFFSFCFGQEICDSKFDVETDLDFESCPQGMYYYHRNINGKYQCFPLCSLAITDSKDECSAIRPCLPGHKCVEKKCEIDESSCLKYHYEMDKSDNKWYKAFKKPECDLNGKFKAKQCKGEEANGLCFCYDEDGKKLFGKQWSNIAQNITCGCSRKRAELLKDPSRAYVSIHCDRHGNYEPLQCDSGQCYCVEPLTGEVISPFVPESFIKELPCYKSEAIGEKYLRQCDSFEYANAIITKQLKIRGTNYANLPKVSCDWDGAYAAIQITSSGAYCTWRDGSQIESWQANLQDMKLMNCNCARDKKYYQESGKTHQLRCDNNGNYYYVQQTDEGKYYCVDEDGFKKHSDYLENLPTLDECNNYLSF